MTATALAAALKADSARFISTWTAFIPPTRALSPDAKKLNEISYDEMLELASLGTKVMQSRSVEFAKKFRVVFEVRSSLNDNPGTIVKEETKSMEGVMRAASRSTKPGQAHAAVVPDQPGPPASSRPSVMRP